MMRSQRDGGLSAITQVKVLSPKLLLSHWAKGFMTWKPVLLHTFKASMSATCRGLSPWQVIERFTSELGRAMPLPTKASNKLKRQGGSMAAWQSDQLIVEA